jgi:hypothetical protein
MVLSDDQEQQLRIEWLGKQMQKADFDMQAWQRDFDERQRQERRKARRETVQIILAAIVAAAAVFAAGHFIR